MLIRNKNKNIVVAKGHGYTVEKVKKVMQFINSSGRNTTVQEWVDIYNYIKGTNDNVPSCKPCAAAKYTQSVRNYAKYGYLTLINEGHKPEEFGIGEEKKVQEPIENEENRIVLQEPKAEEVAEQPVEEVTEEPVEEEVQEDAVVEEIKEALEEEEVEAPKKRGRKSSK